MAAAASEPQVDYLCDRSSCCTSFNIQELRLKRLLKTILPQPALSAARGIRDRAGIWIVPNKPFNSTSLRAASCFSLDTLFADPTTAAAWHDDHEAVSGLLGGNDMPGGDNPGDRRALYHIVGFLQPQNVLELGTFVGASTIHIACALKRFSTAGKLTTVDILDVNDAGGPWKYVGLSMSPRELVRRLDCADVVDFIASRSLDFLKTTRETFDLVYLDGDMSARSVYQDVAAALKVLRPDGVILLHAYFPHAKPLFPDGMIRHGPFCAMARITRANPEIRTMPLGNLPWVTKQGSHATSLALVLRASQSSGSQARRTSTGFVGDFGGITCSAAAAVILPEEQ